MFQTSVITITTIAFAAMGIVAIAAPTRVSRQFGVPELSADGRNEVRAVYGGFGLAVAAGLATALAEPALRAAACAAVALALAGMAAGRIASAVIDRHLGRVTAFYGCLEAAAAAALAAASWV